MKQGSPVHFVAGFFQAIAPYAQRMGRKTERCGILGVPHAAPVHRLHMHAPERAKRNRTAGCPYARCSDCAEVSWVASAASSSTAVPALSGAISADLPHACADPPRSADGAPTASTSPSKDRVGGNSPPRPERFDTKPQHARTRTGCWPLPRNGEAPSVILRATKEPEMGREQNIRKTCRIRTLTHARLGRQDKASYLAAGTSFLRFCLHIVFAPLGFDVARCGDGASDTTFFAFNAPSAIARNVRGRRDRTAYADAGISTLLYDRLISLLPDVFRLPIVVSWHATKTVFAFAPARSAIVMAHGQARAGSAGCADARRASSARFIKPSVARAAPPTVRGEPDRGVAASMRGAAAPRQR